MKRKALQKSLCGFFVLVFLFSLGIVSAFASPESLPSDIVSTKDGLITVRAPETTSSSTTNNKLTISAVASPGTIVTVYRYDGNTGQYQKIWVDGSPLEASVGSSWLFATQVDLQPGLNQFLIRGAWDEYTYSVARFDVNLLKEGFMDRVKGVITVIFN